MLVTPIAELKLLHNASFLKATSDRQKIVVASNQGGISVFNENLTNLYSYKISCSINGLTLSPDGQTLAVKDKDARLIVFQIDGKIIFEEPETTSIKQYGQESDCIFSTDGTQLWDVVVNIDEQVLIQYRETQSWQVLKQAILPFDSSMNYFTLAVHPQNKIISVSEAAGQDGSWTYWVWNDDTKMRVTEITQLQDMAPVEFHSSGEEFLVYNDYNGKLSRYSFPDCHLIRSANLDMEEDSFSFCMTYLYNNKLIVQSEYGRVFIIALNSMKIIDEVILQGHEPQQIKTEDEDYISSDLHWFQGLGQNNIISKHKYNYKDNTCTLLLWKIAEKISILF